MPLSDAVAAARILGDPSLDLAILAEGNTSARDTEDTFWVKASGFTMREITEGGFVLVNFAPILKAFTGDPLTDTGVRELLASSRAQETRLMPSVETFMHAYLLSLPGVEVVGHCHPTAMLSLLCLEEAKVFAQERLFPDEIVCCGPASAFVPYVDPGLPLALAVKNGVEEYVTQHGSVPKTMWMQNHGLICLGKNVKEVESATLMSLKACRARLGMLGSGRKIVTLSQEQIDRIHTRPDEHYRQKLLWEIAAKASQDI